MATPKRVMVIGLDGADPVLLAPSLDSGELPALASLAERGVLLPLCSTTPPVSAPAWASFMTGLSPGGHGVFGFVEEDHAGGGFRLSSLATIRGEKLWEAASRAGKRTAVLNVPVTFPPPPVNGIFVSGMLTPPGRRFTNPEAIEDRIRAIAPAYRTDIDRGLFGDRDRLLAHLLALVDARGEVFLDTLRREPFDLFVAVFTETDRVQHHFWRDRKDDILRVFRRIDGWIGRLIEDAGEDALVLVMSDHGFADTDRRFYANAWLRQEGYLKVRRVREDRDDYERRRFHAFVGEEAKVERKVRLRERLFGLLGLGGRSVIDWSRTRAYLYSASSHGIEINLRGRQPQGCVEPADYEALRDELVERLASLRHPGTGDAVFSRVLRREEAYRGPRVDRAPDIILAPERDRYRIVTRVDAPRPFRQHRVPQGYHGQEGLLLMAGPGVEARGEVRPVIEDLMPTILWALDVPLPRGVDGEPLRGLFSEEVVRERPVRVSEEEISDGDDREGGLTPEEEEALRDSLRELGYL